MGSERAIEPLEHERDVARVAAGESPGHDVAVDHHRTHVPLADAEPFQHALPSAEHGGRAEGDDRVERPGPNGAPRQQHQAHQHRQAPPEGVAREP